VKEGFWSTPKEFGGSLGGFNSMGAKIFFSGKEGGFLQGAPQAAFNREGY